MSRIKKLASETAIYGISSMLGRMFNVLLVPFYVHVFAEERYGIVGIVFAAFAFLNVIYTYGMESAYLKFASGTEGRPKASEVFSTATWMLFASSIVLGILLLLFQDAFSWAIQLDASWEFLLYYMIGILFLDTLTVLPYAELRLQNRPWRFATIRIINISVNIGLNLFFILGLNWDIEAVFIANLIASGVALVLLLPIYKNLFRFSFNALMRKELLLFGLPFLPSGLAYAVTETINKFFLARMEGHRVLELYGQYITEAKLQALALSNHYGEYVVGIFNGIYKVGIFMMLLVQMFRYAWQPFFLQHAEDADAKQLFSRVFTLYNVVAFTVFLGVSFFADQLIMFPLDSVLPFAVFEGKYLIKSTYWFALSIVPVVLLAYLFQGWYYNFAAGLYIEKKTKYFVHITILGACFTLLLNILFVPTYGMMAAAGTTLLAYLVMAIALYFVVQKHYPIKYDWKRVGSIALLAGIVFALWFYFPLFQNGWLELCLLLGYIGMLWGIGIIPKDILSFRKRKNRAAKES